MGCDIHLYVEKRDGEGRWASADKWTPSKYIEEGEPERLEVAYEDRFYRDRCYALFAILADVRNGIGFAGSPTGEGFKPISKPRGLPHDVTPRVKKDSKQWGVDGHSHSHQTLDELLRYDWTQSTVCFCTINGPQLLEWSRYGRAQGEMPNEYCGAVMGRDIKNVSPSELAGMIEELRVRAENTIAPESEADKKPSVDDGTGSFLRNALSRRNRYAEVRDLHEKLVKDLLENHYAQFGLQQPYYKTVRRFWSDCIPRLLALSGGHYESVRIVYWFDN